MRHNPNRILSYNYVLALVNGRKTWGSASLMTSLSVAVALEEASASAPTDMVCPQGLKRAEAGRNLVQTAGQPSEADRREMA